MHRALFLGVAICLSGITARAQDPVKGRPAFYLQRAKIYP
jgi:hypothetical protein